MTEDLFNALKNADPALTDKNRKALTDKDFEALANAYDTYLGLMNTPRDKIFAYQSMATNFAKNKDLFDKLDSESLEKINKVIENTVRGKEVKFKNGMTDPNDDLFPTHDELKPMVNTVNTIENVRKEAEKIFNNFPIPLPKPKGNGFGFHTPGSPDNPINDITGTNAITELFSQITGGQHIPNVEAGQLIKAAQEVLDEMAKNIKKGGVVLS